MNCILSADELESELSRTGHDSILESPSEAQSENQLREAVRLADIQQPVAGDGNELLADRFMCRGGSCLLVGPTGAGKSSLAMQAAILWSIGKPCFGIRPTQPLKILLIQAENDQGDLWEIRHGIYEGLNLFAEQRRQAGEQVRVATVADAVGSCFVATVFRPFLQAHKPDIVVVDPLLAFIGGEIAKQEVTSRFVRSELQPAICEAGCGLILVHHPTKPRQDVGRANAGDDAYWGAGSADLANWARGILVVKPTPHHGIFKLVAPKRGRRLGWTQPDNQTPSLERTIGHGKGGLIYWRDVEQGEQFTAKPADDAAPDLLALVPQVGFVLKASVVEQAKSKGIGEKRAERLLDMLLDQQRLYVWKIPRKNARPSIGFGRDPQTDGE